jgi:hypothetical protein
MRRTLLFLSLITTSPLTAQSAITTTADSILAETCRGGRLSTSGLTCYSATAAPRVTVIRRLAIKIKTLDTVVKTDTLYVLVPPPVPHDTVIVSFNYHTTTVWPSGAVGSFRLPTDTLCAVVDINGITHRGDRRALVTYVSTNVVTWSELPGPCETNSNPVTPVRWVTKNITGIDLPFAEPSTDYGITVTSDTLRIRPGMPYNVFLTFTGATDSATVTISDPTAATVWWNRTRRRYEIFNATTPGPVMITAVWNGIIRTKELVIQ